MNKVFAVCNRANGMIFTKCTSRSKALMAISLYEKCDRYEGIFVEGYYSIIEIN